MQATLRHSLGGRKLPLLLPLDEFVDHGGARRPLQQATLILGLREGALAARHLHVHPTMAGVSASGDNLLGANPNFVLNLKKTFARVIFQEGLKFWSYFLEEKIRHPQ